jgi:heat shock protein HtpX
MMLSITYTEEVIMAWFKRIALFLVVNILVVTVISFLLYVFDVQPFLNSHGLNIPALAIFCLIWGMGGAMISLALSKVMAKWLMGVQIVDPNTSDPRVRAMVAMVHRLAKKAGLPAMPEVGIYHSPEVNAFATGATKSSSLVAVSSGLLNRMNDDQVEAIIGHEITHIASGDMVTMGLLQGVINAFVMFLARLFAFVLLRGGKRDSDAPVSPFAYQMLVFVMEMGFMILGMLVIARFSRFREFRADAGGARLAGKDKMIAALQGLQRFSQIEDKELQPAFQTMKISSKQGMLRFFATHPPLEERIERLQQFS